ncbi:hypothetical protein [Klenkia brasiliensis]|uniref:Uncharacterized protein n=1 Tax=Klenkia brasiliensis TaxID=333142 RepID=A0A1G7YEB0_9ACTN|nr:hypothetical protein [Klenkia brasiliensis]SDG94697.1 hypothetical protein SAMN05660324_3924 [Klenkia brasiliensis]
MTESTPAVPADRPQPVLRAAQAAAAVSGLVAAIGAILTLVGWVTADQVQSWVVAAGGLTTAVATFVAVAAPILAALRAREAVTPLEAPLSADGVPLVTDLPGNHAADS